MASAMKKTKGVQLKKSKQRQNEYSQVLYEADMVEELNRSSASELGFLRASAKKTKKSKEETNKENNSQLLPYEAGEIEELNRSLPHEAAEADEVEELSQLPPSPEYLPPTPEYPPHTPEYSSPVSPIHPTASSQTPDDSSSSSKSTQTENVARKKRTLLTREKLLTVNCDILRRSLAPIKKWESLLEGHPYLLKRIVSMPIRKKKETESTSEKTVYVEDTGYYAELETEKDKLMNVWITPFMLSESEKHDLSSNDVYIIPLGKKQAQESGYDYHSFVIVRGDDLEYNIN
jgi:hypothetical protein